jgi:hypothetical protein
LATTAGEADLFCASCTLEPFRHAQRHPGTRFHQRRRAFAIASAGQEQIETSARGQINPEGSASARRQPSSRLRSRIRRRARRECASSLWR